MTEVELSEEDLLNETPYGQDRAGEHSWSSSPTMVAKSAKYLVKHKKTGKTLSVHTNAQSAVTARNKVGNMDTHSIIKEEEELEELNKSTYVKAIRTATDPEADKGNVDKILARAKKYHGDKFSKDLEGGIEKMHYPRDGHTNGYDKLADRKFSRVNKSGKANNQDVSTLKAKLKEESMNEQDLEEGMKSHQAKTTLKGIKNPSYTQRAASADIKPGIAGYRDRVDLLKAAKEKGNLKENVAALIDAISTGRSTDIEDSFNAIMSEKMVAALDAKRQEVAEQLFSEEVDSIEELSRSTLNSFVKKSKEKTKELQQKGGETDSKKMSAAIFADRDRNNTARSKANMRLKGAVNRNQVVYTAK